MEESSVSVVASTRFRMAKIIVIGVGALLGTVVLAGAGHGVYVMIKKNMETSQAGTGGAPSSGCPLPSWLGVK